MTLPNRSGYSVGEKKPSPQPQIPTPQPQVPNELPQKPPTLPTNMHNPYELEPSVPISQTQPTFYHPLYAQNEMLKAQERSTVQPNESLSDMPHTTGTYKVMDPFRHPEQVPNRLEEQQTRKNYVKYHRLLPAMIELLAYCKKEAVIPPVSSDSADLQGNRGPTDFGLEDFITSQGIEVGPLYTDDGKKNQERTEFVEKLEQLKIKYAEELDKLNRVLNEFCTRALTLLQEQSQFRPVSEMETHLKLFAIQQKFDYVRNQLRQNVCNAILVLQKQYNQVRKKRRTLSKRATEGLTNWFFEHLNDPYPSEEEKSMLAAHGGLTITQVNNWFGNKRIRYKRKCLAEENRRQGGTLGNLSPSQTPTTPIPDTPSSTSSNSPPQTLTTTTNPFPSTSNHQHNTGSTNHQLLQTMANMFGSNPNSQVMSLGMSPMHRSTNPLVSHNSTYLPMHSPLTSNIPQMNLNPQYHLPSNHPLAMQINQNISMGNPDGSVESVPTYSTTSANFESSISTKS